MYIRREIFYEKKINYDYNLWQETINEVSVLIAVLIIKYSFTGYCTGYSVNSVKKNIKEKWWAKRNLSSLIKASFIEFLFFFLS